MPVPSRFNRRRLLRAGAAAGVAAAAGSCTHIDPVLDRRLPRPHGKVKGYKGLAELPYYRLNDAGRPELTPKYRELLPAAVDFHAHLGFFLMFAPKLDYQRDTTETVHLIDCDGPPPCDLYHDDYLNKIADEEMLAEMEEHLVRSGLDGGEAAPTHTIPNLLEEMRDTKTDHAVLLAIQLPFPLRNNPTMAWYDAVHEAGVPDKLKVFGGLEPRNSAAPAILKRYAKIGMKGIKLHPPQQQLAPNHPAAMKIYEQCERYGMKVFFHAGRAGIEPSFQQEFARMHLYEEPVRTFPNVEFIFGHAGARDFEPATDIAARYDNVYLEIEGQGVRELKYIMERVDDQRLLFGSDWPFYPLAATQARVLLATEDMPTKTRDRILALNGRRVLGLDA